jgi:transcriptional/translational regulatory protein YebC/TACO1
MGAQWKHSGRVENAAKRGQLISKMVKEKIIVATKSSRSRNPANNARLRACSGSGPKGLGARSAIISSAPLKKGAGLLEPVNYETVTFEGFSPRQSTRYRATAASPENRNRTSADIRVLFQRVHWAQAALSPICLITWGWSRPPQLIRTRILKRLRSKWAHGKLRPRKTGARFLCDKTDLVTVTKALEAMGWKVEASEFAWIAKDKVELGEEAKKEVIAFLNDIDDNDDVHRLYTALRVELLENKS